MPTCSLKLTSFCKLFACDWGLRGWRDFDFRLRWQGAPRYQEVGRVSGLVWHQRWLIKYRCCAPILMPCSPSHPAAQDCLGSCLLRVFVVGFVAGQNSTSLPAKISAELLACNYEAGANSHAQSRCSGIDGLSPRLPPAWQLYGLESIEKGKT